MCSLTLIMASSGGYGSPQPLPWGGMPGSGVGVGGGVGAVVGGTGAPGVAGELPQAMCAARALAAAKRRTEESTLTVRAPMSRGWRSWKSLAHSDRLRSLDSGRCGDGRGGVAAGYRGRTLMRIRRYSIWPRSPSTPIGPDAGSASASSSTSPLHVGVGHPAADRHHQLVPVLRPVALEALVGSREPVVAALQLRPAEVDAAVGVRRGAELELEHEVLGELARRPELLDLPVLGRRRHHQPAVDGGEAPVGRRRSGRRSGRAR